MTAPGGPGEWGGPRWIIGEVWLGATAEEEFHHFGPTELRGPSQRRGADVFVACMQVRAVVEKPGGFLHVPAASKMMQRGGPQPVGGVRVHAVLEEQLV